MESIQLLVTVCVWVRWILKLEFFTCKQEFVFSEYKSQQRPIIKPSDLKQAELWMSSDETCTQMLRN